MNYLLETNHLAIGYHRHAIIENIQFRLNTQQICCVLGANGAGKSTFLKTLLGLQPAIAGEIYFKQRPLHAWQANQLAQQIAYVPQAHHSLFPFSALEMVLMGRSAYLKWYQTPATQDEKIAMEALENLEIAHLAKRLYPELSGGEKQLVLIARAIAQNADLLIMDEPTASLDFGNQIRVLEKIHALRTQQRAILITTHHPQQAAFLATHDQDSIVILNQHAHPAFEQGQKAPLLQLAKLAHAYRIEPERLAQHLNLQGQP